MVLDAMPTNLPKGAALIFPHTRLSTSGHLIAAAARAVIESGCDTVLAIGVLHGGKRDDLSLRGIHGPDAPRDKGIWKDEFSLDNFSVLLAIAAELAGKPMPRLIARYPFLTGDDPNSLPGFEELHKLLDDGAALVATADLIHHGVGYGTPKAERLSRTDTATFATVRYWIEEQFELLSFGDYAGLLAKAEAVRSDFRDGGPVAAALVAGHRDAVPSFSIDDLTLVDYADVLQEADPTWVAAAILRYR